MKSVCKYSVSGDLAKYFMSQNCSNILQFKLKELTDIHTLVPERIKMSLGNLKMSGMHLFVAVLIRSSLRGQ